MADSPQLLADDLAAGSLSEEVSAELPPESPSGPVEIESQPAETPEARQAEVGSGYDEEYGSSLPSKSAPSRTLGEDADCNGIVVLHGMDWFLSKPKAWRRTLIQRPWMLPVVAMQLSALTLQRAWRSSWLFLAKPSSAGLTVPGIVRASLPQARPAIRPLGAPASIADRRSQAAAALRHRYFALMRRRCDAVILQLNEGSMVYPSLEHFCAAIIQGRWQSRNRLRIAWRVHRYRRFKLFHVAAFEIQRTWRAWSKARGARLANELAQREAQDAWVQHARLCDSAARKLQNAWRGALSYRVYESLKDTIASFRRCGDPCLLLRSVLPRESMLLDPAMQVHVRFRLGGARFPPSIYYKIYTHGAVVDLCSFAPRNYAGERANALRQMRPDCVDNGAAWEANVWYEREENNGWRPLAPRASPGEERLRDEVERASAHKPVGNFHYSRLRRRQDLERRRKQRTVEWMRKLYGLQQETLHAEHQAAIDEATNASLQAEMFLQTTQETEGDVRLDDQGAGFAAGAPSAPSGAARSLAVAVQAEQRLDAVAAAEARLSEVAFAQARLSAVGPAIAAAEKRLTLSEASLMQPQRPSGAPPVGRPSRKSLAARQSLSAVAGRPSLRASLAAVREKASTVGDLARSISPSSSGSGNDELVGSARDMKRSSQRWLAGDSPKGASKRATLQDARHSQDSEEIEEADNEELLEWSRQLDFESYMEGWQTAATSTGSDGTLPIAIGHLRSLLPMMVH